ncbi:MAG TPA: MarR family transcriptional regulator [Actinopolymorphaceae bacterium]|nr:MarR family transcriptional regulator [Actinopolymorphaceae bacterium]
MSAHARRAGSGPPHRGPVSADEAWWLLYEFLKTVQERWNAFVQSSGLTPVQVQLLHEVATAGPTPMRGLASRLDVDPSWVTGLVHQLEERGFVQRHPSTTDRRIKIVRLTALGEGRHREWQRILHSPPDGLQALSGDDTRELIRILRETLRVERARGVAEARA